MKGTVKWFSQEKGYGFIHDEAQEDRFFSIRDIVGVTLPGNGDRVSFDPETGNKGPKATLVNIDKRSTSSQDERVTCNRCDKKMIPRIITGQTYSGTPEPKKSICPFCGGIYRSFEKDNSTVIVIAIIVFAVNIGIVAYFK